VGEQSPALRSAVREGSLKTGDTHHGVAGFSLLARHAIRVQEISPPHF